MGKEAEEPENEPDVIQETINCIVIGRRVSVDFVHDLWEV